MQRAFFVPEVIQTSAMDCGPAVLKAMLEGFGISASYGHLREACQTSVDGTNINTIEDVMNQLGLEAQQVMLPPDHLLLEAAEALPALLVVRLPNGSTHFIIVWNMFGSWVQIMDPGTGRRWVRRQQLLDQVFLHTHPVDASAWRAWAGSPLLIEPLRAQMEALRLPSATSADLLMRANADPTWRSFAALDAAIRMTTALVKTGGVEAGSEAAALADSLFSVNSDSTSEASLMPIPPLFWTVQPHTTSPAAAADTLLLRGAVLIRVVGRRSDAKRASDDGQMTDADGDTPTVPLSPELQAALTERPLHPEQEIWQRLRVDGIRPVVLLMMGIVIATIGVLTQTLILQGVLKVGHILPLLGEPVWVAVSLLIFFAALLLLNLAVSTLTQRMGRRLETRLRIAFLEKLPKLNDRYFHSRLVSDMAQRAHELRNLRMFPAEVLGLYRTACELLLTTMGILYLQPVLGGFALGGAVLFAAIALLTRTFLQESGMRLRVHAGALSRFFLDAMQGLIPLRTHSAERAFRREYEGLLIEWGRANYAYGQQIGMFQAVAAVIYAVCSVWIVLSFTTTATDLTMVFLVLYWTLRLPSLSSDFITRLQNYPLLRNGILRLLEPLNTPEEPVSAEEPPATPAHPTPAAAIAMEQVSVIAGGQPLLTDITLTITPGEHVAIVGSSGAGKSTLVGVLLGWHTPARGVCRVDGAPLTAARLAELRLQTAWVDPAVQLWNRSLSENLLYGRDETTAADALYLEQAELLELIERLPEGMQTALGENGGLVSGGEGQRVRLGRAFGRRDARLVILDEPFRGLERSKRRQLLAQARKHWHDSTILCITHDVGETSTFDRVLVIEGGRLVEDAPPTVLAAQHSRYSDLLSAETIVRQTLWEGTRWRRLWVAQGRVEESVGEDEP